MILAEWEQIFNDFQHGVRCPTRLLARRRVRSTLNNNHDSSSYYYHDNYNHEIVMMIIIILISHYHVYVRQAHWRVRPSALSPCSPVVLLS